MTGQTISHYKVLDKLGEGGMGVVYKAQDTNLDRIVALKFLPPHLAASEQDKARFVQEAKAASSLDHPNICTVYEIGEEADNRLFIAMAYYDGETLSSKIRRRPLPIAEAVNIALSVAEGLATAHKKNIIHRDIKSDNIMLTVRGMVKIMDFGLARIIGGTTLTKSGTTIGTVPYMSPEQARGETVDHRTDIWSLGVVMYEMLTGQRPFRSEYNAAVVYSILNQGPEPISSLRSNVPLELERMTSKCLEKAPGDRYQSAEEVIVDLRTLHRSSTGSRSAGIVGGNVPQRTSRKKRMLLIVSGLVSAILAVVFLFLLASRSLHLNPKMSLHVLHVPFSTTIGSPGLSADGNWAAFPAADQYGKWDVYLMNTRSGESRRITTDSSYFIPLTDITTDGSQIVYDVWPRSGPPAIFTVSALGAKSRLLIENGVLPKWQADGERIFFHRAFAGWRAESKSGKLEVWSVKQNGTDERLEFIDSVSFPKSIALSISPEGKSVAWLRNSPDGSYQEVFVRELRSGKEMQLTFDKKNIDELCWSMNNQIIYSSNKSGSFNLWMTPALGGSDVQITSGSQTDLGMKISADGSRLLYSQVQIFRNMWIGSLINGTTQQVTFDETYKTDPICSPDGNYLAFALQPNTSQEHFILYVCNRDGTNRREISSGKRLTSLTWSPDGKRIAYAIVDLSVPRDSIGFNKTFIVDVVKTNASRFIANGFPAAWLDSSFVFVHLHGKTWLSSLETGEQHQVLQDSMYAFPVLGGNYYLYNDLRELYEGLWIVDSRPGFLSKGKQRKLLEAGKPWSSSPDANYFLYSESRGELWKVSLPSGKREPVQGTYQGLESSFTVSKDGREVIYSQHRQQGRLVMIENPFENQ